MRDHFFALAVALLLGTTVLSQSPSVTTAAVPTGGITMSPTTTVFPSGTSTTTITSIGNPNTLPPTGLLLTDTSAISSSTSSASGNGTTAKGTFTFSGTATATPTGKSGAEPEGSGGWRWAGLAGAMLSMAVLFAEF